MAYSAPPYTHARPKQAKIEFLAGITSIHPCQDFTSFTATQELLIIKLLMILSNRV